MIVRHGDNVSLDIAKLLQQTYISAEIKEAGLYLVRLCYLKSAPKAQILKIWQRVRYRQSRKAPADCLAI